MKTVKAPRKTVPFSTSSSDKPPINFITFDISNKDTDSLSMNEPTLSTLDKSPNLPIAPMAVNNVPIARTISVNPAKPCLYWSIFILPISLILAASMRIDAPIAIKPDFKPLIETLLLSSVTDAVSILLIAKAKAAITPANTTTVATASSNLSGST